MLSARVSLLALPTADCPWCGARPGGEAQPEAVTSRTDLALRN